MRVSSILFILATVFATPAIAQSADSIRHRADSILQQHGSRYDSTANRVNNKIDSAQLRINNLLNPNLGAIKQKLARTRTRKDTLQAAHKLDSAKGKLTHQIDSLKRLNLPTDHLTRKLDSVKQYNPARYLAQAETKANELESKLNQPLNQVEGKVNDKLALMNKEGGAGANIPGATNLPGAELNTQLDTNLNTNLNLPNSDLKIDNPLNGVDNPLKDELNQAQELKGKVNDVKSMPQQQLEKVKSIDEVKNAQDKLGDANQLTDKAQAYSQDAKNLATGNLEEVKELPNALEGQVKKMDEIKELEKQSGELGKYQQMIGQGNDPEAMKELAKDQAVTYAKDHFAGKQEVLQAAMDKMTKLKTKYASLDSLTNIPKYKPNSMKGKPFVERLVPGITFQIQKSGNVWVDYEAMIGYRINGRLTAGLGWNERVGVAKKFRVTTADRIYGPRSYLSCMVWKGFAAHVELEKMFTSVPSELVPYSDERGKAWIWSAFIGVKKQYNFSKHVKGHFQFLYNFYDDHDSSPYLDRFNVRFGFEFPLKKKVRGNKAADKTQ